MHSLHCHIQGNNTIVTIAMAILKLPNGLCNVFKIFNLFSEIETEDKARLDLSEAFKHEIQKLTQLFGKE